MSNDFEKQLPQETSRNQISIIQNQKLILRGIDAISGTPCTLCDEGDIITRTLLALNPCLPASLSKTILDKTNSHQKTLLQGIAKKSNNTFILTTLSTNTDECIRCCVGLNYHTPTSILDTLAKDVDELVSDAAKSIIDFNEFNNKLIANHKTTKSKNDSPQNATSPVITTITKEIASNPETDPSILSQFLNSSSNEIRICIALNPQTPPSLISELLQDHDANVRNSAIMNPSLPMAEKIRLAKLAGIIGWP